MIRLTLALVVSAALVVAARLVYRVLDINTRTKDEQHRAALTAANRR